MEFDENDLEMTIIDNELEMPLELLTRPVLLNDLFHYVQRHQNNTMLYQSEFDVRILRLFFYLFICTLSSHSSRYTGYFFAYTYM